MQQLQCYKTDNQSRSVVVFDRQCFGFPFFSGMVTSSLLACRLLPWEVQLELHWWEEHSQVSMMHIVTKTK